MRSIPPSSSATRATTATAFATTWRSEASNPSSRHDRTARHQSNTIGKPTSGATSSSGASIASSNSGASPPDTRKRPELTFQCYASQQRNSGSKPSTRPSRYSGSGSGCSLDCPRGTCGLYRSLALRGREALPLITFHYQSQTARDGRTFVCVVPLFVRFRYEGRPLSPSKRTFPRRISSSEKCQKATSRDPAVNSDAPSSGARQPREGAHTPLLRFGVEYPPRGAAWLLPGSHQAQTSCHRGVRGAAPVSV